MSNFQSRWDVAEEIGKYVDAKYYLLNLKNKDQIDFEDLEKAYNILEDRAKVLKAYEKHLEDDGKRVDPQDPESIKKSIQQTLGRLEEQWGNKQ